MESKAVNLLRLLRGSPGEIPGLRVVTVKTAEPDEVTMAFEGTPLALDLDIFEIPVSCYPLRKGDSFLSFPIAGGGTAPRWGLLEKLNGGPSYLATMQTATSLKIDGSDKVYTVTDLVIPQYLVVSNGSANGYLLAADIRPLQAGDRVAVVPTWDSGQVKYVITNKY
ncbi:MAG: hypothetical protein ACYC0N_02230 [Carboxydocellales bacterium]